MIFKNKLKFIKVIYFIFLLIPAFLILSPEKKTSPSYQMGQLSGALAITMLSIQFVLSSRFKFLEKSVGYDKIIKLHSQNARFMLLFVLIHPLFLFSAITPFTLDYWQGKLALLLLLIVATTSIYSDKLKINYENWKVIHKLTYLIVFLGFFHSFTEGSDIVSQSPFYYWWLFLMFLVIVSVAHRFKKLYFNKNIYEVVDIRKETNSVRTVSLRPLRGKLFNYNPAQFAFVTFYSDALPKEEHHFTITSTPEEETLSFTIKESGDFTSKLGLLKKGDKAKLDGPYGALSESLGEDSALFIAAGIGITPIKNLLSKGSKLIYAVKNEKEIVFKDFLEKKAKKNEIDLVYVFSRKLPPNIKFKAYKGHIDKKILEKEFNGFKKVVLVAPPALVKVLKKDLISLGVEKTNIFIEIFSLK